MKIRNLVSPKIISFLFLSVFALPVVAKEETNYQMYLMSQNHFSLAAMDKYKSDIKKAIVILKAKKFDRQYSASQVSGGGIYWFTPIKDYGDIDTLDQQWDSVWEQLSDEEQAVFNGLGVGVKSGREMVIKYDGDLSYEIKDMKGYLYFEGSTYQFKHGKSEQVKAVAKQIRDRYEASQAKQPYRFFWHELGGDIRTFTVVSYGKNKMHFAKTDAHDDKMFEKDVSMSAIWQEAMQLVDVVDSFQGKMLTDLRYSLK